MKKILIIACAILDMNFSNTSSDSKDNTTHVIPLTVGNEIINIPSQLPNPPKVMVINNSPRSSGFYIRANYKNDNFDYELLKDALFVLKKEEKLIPVQISGTFNNKPYMLSSVAMHRADNNPNLASHTFTKDEIELLNTGNAFIEVIKDDNANNYNITVGRPAAAPAAPPAPSPFSDETQAESKLVKAGAYSSNG